MCLLIHKLNWADWSQHTEYANADELASLLANIAKSSSLERLISLERSKVPSLSPSPLAVTQLVGLFNRGASKGYNTDTRYDYLAYLFADLAKVPAGYPSYSKSALTHDVVPSVCKISHNATFRHAPRPTHYILSPHHFALSHSPARNRIPPEERRPHSC